MANIIKYMSRRSIRAHASCPSERAGDTVAKLKRELRRTLRRRLKTIDDHGQSLVAGTYWF